MRSLRSMYKSRRDHNSSYAKSTLLFWDIFIANGVGMYSMHKHWVWEGRVRFCNSTTKNSMFLTLQLLLTNNYEILKLDSKTFIKRMGTCTVHCNVFTNLERSVIFFFVILISKPHKSFNDTCGSWYLIGIVAASTNDDDDKKVMFLVLEENVNKIKDEKDVI